MNTRKLALTFFISLFFLASYAESQEIPEINEDFLNSLPEDIKADLIEKNAQQNLSTEKNYRPYLYSSKLSLLKEEEEEDDYKIFGSDFFNSFQTTYMPINEPNPDGSYLLDAGDILNIQLVGKKNQIDNFLINGNGSIAFPDIGYITLAGLTLSEASALIKSKINSAFIGTEAMISLEEIRDVNVLITGNAKNPGIYTLTGNSNILQAISAAGGISKYGSLREINLIRNNLIVETLDVYDLLIDGKYNIKKRLRSGDVIFVEARKNVVSIDGAVYRPARYEVHNKQNLGGIVEYANGIKRTADMNNVSLERILDGNLKTIPIVNVSQLNNIEALDGDLIYIREYPYREAKILGAVNKPGTYSMAPGQTLDDLIAIAGGYTLNAYPFGAVYENQDAKVINQKAKEILYQEFLTNILAITQQNIGQNIDLTSLVQLTNETKNNEPNGRVVINLNDENSLYMYPIKNNDSLFIPEKANVVYVYGEVSSEGAVMYLAGEDVEHYINKSGGYKKYSDNKSIYILHPNGESQLYSAKRNIFESSPEKNIKIYPGSIIFIPRELDDATPRRLAAQAYVSILGNIGIAIASLASINNN